MGGNRAWKNAKSIGKMTHQIKVQKLRVDPGHGSQLTDYTVVSMVSITSRSDCDGERRVHSSGSQLLSGL